MNISKKDFREYESLRVSGRVNMYMLPMLGYDKDVCTYIMDNYEMLSCKYPDVIKEEKELQTLVASYM